jgi:hypothetical protein
VQPVLTANCTGQGCHSGSGAQLGQDVSEGNAYKSLVNVKSEEVPELFRVKPGDSANSYVYQKLTQNPPQVGDPMPLGNFPLSPDKIEIIKRWIDGGALP